MDTAVSRPASMLDIAFTDPAFQRLSTDEREAVVSSSIRRTFRPGAYVYRRGDNPDGIYIVLRGFVRVTGQSRGGEEFILDICGRGLWIGDIAVLEGCERSHDAIAEAPSELAYIPCADVERLLSTYPGFSRALLRLEAKRFRQVTDWAEQSATAPLDVRLAVRLSMLARRDPLFKVAEKVLEMKVTQETLSRLLGTTRQRVNQLLQEWEAEGLVRISRGSLTILNLRELEARFGDSAILRGAL